MREDRRQGEVDSIVSGQVLTRWPLAIACMRWPSGLRVSSRSSTPASRPPGLDHHRRLVGYQQLRAAYAGKNPAEGKRIAEKVIDSFPSCPIPEVARRGRTLRAWRQQILAYFTTSGVSNGGT